jgi:hypothetical protein
MYDKLAAPFDPSKISWRVGSTTQDKKKGMALAYIDSRDVQERLDTVCTPGGWQCRYSAIAAKTCCEIGIKIGGNGYGRPMVPVIPILRPKRGRFQTPSSAPPLNGVSGGICTTCPRHGLQLSLWGGPMP